MNADSVYHTESYIDSNSSTLIHLNSIQRFGLWMSKYFFYMERTVVLLQDMFNPCNCCIHFDVLFICTWGYLIRTSHHYRLLPESDFLFVRHFINSLERE